MSFTGIERQTDIGASFITKADEIKFGISTSGRYPENVCKSHHVHGFGKSTEIISDCVSKSLGIFG